MHRSFASLRMTQSEFVPFCGHVDANYGTRQSIGGVVISRWSVSRSLILTGEEVR